MGKVVNKRELSEILGVSERSLTEWQEEDPPLPVLRRGERGQTNEYDTAAVIDWRIGREMRRAQIEKPGDRLDRLRGDREELELAKLRRTLIPAEEIEPALEQYVTDVLNYLQGIPERYAGMLQAMEDVEGKRQLLEDLVREFRDELGSYAFATKRIHGTDAAAGDAEVSAAA